MKKIYCIWCVLRVAFTLTTIFDMHTFPDVLLLLSVLLSTKSACILHVVNILQVNVIVVVLVNRLITLTFVHF